MSLDNYSIIAHNIENDSNIDNEFKDNIIKFLDFNYIFKDSVNLHNEYENIKLLTFEVINFSHVKEFMMRFEKFLNNDHCKIKNKKLYISSKLYECNVIISKDEFYNDTMCCKQIYQKFNRS